MLPIYVATGNPGKLREINQIGEEFLPYFEKPWRGRAPLNVEETEKTFMGNARIKMRALVAELLKEGFDNFAVIADDSGIEVDALGGRPGVFSARYAGDHVDPKMHIAKLINELKDKKNRGAQYFCALALGVVAQKKLREFHGEGICRGEIMSEGRGGSGFGYDPIFFVPELGKTMSELDMNTKNSISHRWQAFKKLATVYSHENI